MRDPARFQPGHARSCPWRRASPGTRLREPLAAFAAREGLLNVHGVPSLPDAGVHAASNDCLMNWIERLQEVPPGLIDPDIIKDEIDRAVPCVGKAGSMSFHHVRALHGSAQNTSDRPRNLLLYEVAASDAWRAMSTFSTGRLRLSCLA